MGKNFNHQIIYKKTHLFFTCEVMGENFAAKKCNSTFRKKKEMDLDCVVVCFL